MTILAATTTVTNTAAVSTGVTLTLAAPSAGCFHYITYVEVSQFLTAALTPGATPTQITTTNLNGSPIFDFGNAAGAAGVSNVRQWTPDLPLKSSVAATATTFVAPAFTGVIWRLTAFYLIGPG